MIWTLVIATTILLRGANCACRHSDCIGQQMCYGDKCVPAKPAGGMCTTDSNCETSSGQACISGICMVPAVTTPAPPVTVAPSLPIPIQQLCVPNNHDMCPGQQMCLLYICVPAIPVGKTCKSTTDCSTGQACKFGDCWTPAITFPNLG